MSDGKDFQCHTVGSITYTAFLLFHFSTTDYRAACRYCTMFRTQIEEVKAKACYDNNVREPVLNRVLDDRMKVQPIPYVGAAYLGPGHEAFDVSADPNLPGFEPPNLKLRDSAAVGRLNTQMLL